MSARELVILGTSSMLPTRYRNHNGYLLLWDGQGLLFDPGEGTQRQMVMAGVRSHQIHRICVTHFHGDHCLGLPGVLQRASVDVVPHELFVHYPASGQRYFDRLRHASIYVDQAHVTPVPHRTGAQPVEIGRGPSWTLWGAALDHRTEATGYRLQEDEGWVVDPALAAAAGVRGPDIGRVLREGEIEVEGRRIHREMLARPRPPQSVAVVMDTRPCAAALALAQGVDLLICESTYLSSEAREAHDHGHLTAADAARIAKEAGARKLVLTHFSQRYTSTRDFVREAEAIFPDVEAAEDLARIPIPARRTA